MTTVTLRVRVQSNAGASPFNSLRLTPQLLLLVALLTLFATLAWFTQKTAPSARARVATVALLWMVALASLTAACGGSVSPFHGPVQFTVNATSGAISHSSTVTVTIP